MAQLEQWAAKLAGAHRYNLCAQERGKQWGRYVVEIGKNLSKGAIASIRKWLEENKVVL